MNCREWDGRDLGVQLLAMSLLMGSGPAKVGKALVVQGAVAAGNLRLLIRPKQLGEFLRVHRGRVIICHEAGPFIEGMQEHLTRSGDVAALKILREFLSNRRIYDVSILERLVTHAEGGLHRPGRSLVALALDYCAISLPSGPSPGACLEALPGLASVTMDRALTEYALVTAQAILAIFEVVYEPACRIAERPGVYPEAACDWGPLSLGIQVQGDVSAHLLGRRGLPVRKDAVGSLRERCEDCFRKCSRQLYSDASARRCFHWKAKGRAAEVALDESGRPVVDGSALERWLASSLASSPGLHGIPFRPPQSDMGRISTSPALWDDLARVTPLLWAWCRLNAATDALSCLGGLDVTGERLLHPSYEVLPRIKSSGPNLEQLRSIHGSATFEAPPGHSLLVVELLDLELRCLAEMLVRTEMRSKMAELFNSGDDPVRYTAAALFDPAGFLRRDPRWRDGLDELSRSDPVQIEILMQVARTFLKCTARGLSHEQIRERLEQEHEDRPALPATEMFHHVIVNEIFPELDPHLRNPTQGLLCYAIAARPLDMAFLNLGPGSRKEDATVRLRDALSGKRKDPSLLARLGEISNDPTWRERLAKGRGSQQIYDEILLRDPVTGTGRVRGRLDAHQAAAAVYLDLADDFRKIVLHAIEVAGHEPVASAGDQIVLLVPDKAKGTSGAIEAAKVEITSVVEVAAMELFESVPIVCQMWSPPAW